MRLSADGPTRSSGGARGRRSAPRSTTVVVPPAALVARSEPVAHRAVLDGLGVRRSVWISERVREIPADEAEVWEVRPDAERLAAPAATEHEVRRVRHQLLRPRQKIGVEAELDQRAGFRLARELRVDNLVRPGPERARPLHADEEVREPCPFPVRERGLVHSWSARAERRERGGNAVGRRAVRDLHDVDPLVSQRAQVRPLVLHAAGSQQLRRRVVTDGTRESSGGRGGVERRQVRALEEPGDVGRRCDDAS